MAVGVTLAANVTLAVSGTLAVDVILAVTGGLKLSQRQRKGQHPVHAYGFNLKPQTI